MGWAVGLGSGSDYLSLVVMGFPGVDPFRRKIEKNVKFEFEFF